MKLIIPGVYRNLIVLAAAVVLVACDREPSKVQTGDAPDHVAVWRAAVDGGNNVADLAQKLRTPNAASWPAIPSAPAGSSPAARDLARAVFEVIERAEWDRQQIDEATERAFVDDYVTIAQAVRKAGGYHNYVLADAVTRLAVVRLATWSVRHPTQSTEAVALLATLRASPLDVPALKQLVAEQGPLPAPKYAHMAPKPVPSSGSTAALAQYDISEAIALLGGAPAGTAFGLGGERDRLVRTRELLNTTDVRLLLYRIDQTEQMMWFRYGDLIDCYALREGHRRAASDVPVTFQELLDRRPPPPLPPRFPTPVRFNAMLATDLAGVLQKWPATPLPDYLIAVDAPPSGYKAQRRVVVAETPLGQVPADFRGWDFNESVAISPDCTRWVTSVPRGAGRTWAENGKMLGQDPAAGPLAYTGDGRLVCGWIGAAGPYVSLAGTPGQPSDPQTPVWGPNLRCSKDGKRVMYPRRFGGKTYVFVDGKDFGPYVEVLTSAFSPDGTSAGWITADAAGKLTLYVEGQARSLREYTPPPHSDAAPRALVGGDSIVEDPTFDGRVEGLQRVWTDPRTGARATVASPEGGPVYSGPAVIDVAGRRTGPVFITRVFGFVADGSFAFQSLGTSPAGSGDVPVVMTIGEYASGEHSRLTAPAAPPSGKHHVFAARTGAVWRVVVDGIETTQTYDAVPSTPFANNAGFRLIAQRGKDVLMVEGRWRPPLN